jgi:polysaccharide pyruvyl transferase WcaK-like protein
MAIAFEALYLNDAGDSKNELTYRLALRAARFLRHTMQERAEVFDIVRDLYNFRSIIAHGGGIEDLNEGKRKKLDQVLARCPALLKETLLALLEGKGPWKRSDKKQDQTWRKIELA